MKEFNYVVTMSGYLHLQIMFPPALATSFVSSLKPIRVYPRFVPRRCTQYYSVARTICRVVLIALRASTLLAPDLPG